MGEIAQSHEERAGIVRLAVPMLKGDLAFEVAVRLADGADAKVIRDELGISQTTLQREIAKIREILIANGIRF